MCVLILFIVVWVVASSFIGIGWGLLAALGIIGILEAILNS